MDNRCLLQGNKSEVNRRREQAALGVGMECAGMQALCNFRNTDFFQFKSKIMLLAFELGLKIMK